MYHFLKSCVYCTKDTLSDLYILWLRAQIIDTCWPRQSLLLFAEVSVNIRGSLCKAVFGTEIKFPWMRGNNSAIQLLVTVNDFFFLFFLKRESCERCLCLFLDKHCYFADFMFIWVSIATDSSDIIRGGYNSLNNKDVPILCLARNKFIDGRVYEYLRSV